MKRVIQVGSDLRELCRHGTPAFPLEINHDDLDTFQGHFIRCHWHDELELSILLEGRVVYQAGGTSYDFSRGQGIVVNTAVPHTLTPACPGPIRLLTIIVHPSLLGGEAALSVLEPYLHSGQLASVLLRPEIDWQRGILDSLRQIDALYAEKPFAFELKIISLLCGSFHLLIARCQDRLAPAVRQSPEDLKRLDALLSYLHAHYGDCVSLSELASQIPMARESCCRFFKKMTGKTITRYLEDYRIAQSLPLLRDGRLSVTETASMVGFGNTGRFSGAFRKRMGVPPSVYRRNPHL